MGLYVDLGGFEVEVLFGGHERGRRIERSITIQEVLTYLELAGDEILDLKFNQDFAVVSGCKSKAIIGVLKNNKGNIFLDIKTVLNTEGARDIYLKPNTVGIYLAI